MPTISLTRLSFPGLAALIAAPAALLLTPGRAEAILTYNIFESGGNVVVETNGSLDLPSPITTSQCGARGLIRSVIAALCTGLDSPGSLNDYTITGPTSFDGTVFAVPASSVSGIGTVLRGNTPLIGFRIGSSYVNNSPIVSSATFNNQTLAGLGFTISSGLIGTWTLSGTGDTINVVLGAPAAVPGPLPLFGAAAAFGWSRTLRRRISASGSTSNA